MSVHDGIYALLAGRDGHLPRRAVVRPDGSVCDMSEVDGGDEVHVLSRICELVAAARGLPVYSRAPRELLGACLATNDPGAWLALANDHITGCLPETEVFEYFRESPDDAAGFARSLIDTQSVLHAVAVVRVMAACLPTFNTAAARAFSDALRNGRGVLMMQAFSAHCRSLPVATRTASLQALGATVQSPQSAGEMLMDLVGRAAAAATVDCITVLAHSPAMPKVDNVTRHAAIPWLFKTLSTYPAPRRGPAMLLLAALVAPIRGNDAVGKAVEKVIAVTLETCSAPDTVHAAARLVEAAVDPKHPLAIMSKFV